MKYPIKDIKEGVEFVIDDDKTFDELIEFYLPFRHSELSSIDPSKPGDYDSNLNEKFFRYKDSSEIYDWADKVVNAVNCDHAIRLYVALATYADKNKADRVLALDIIYCLIGLTNQWFFDDMDGHFEESRLSIANQIVIEWGNYEIAKFLIDETLNQACLINLQLDIKPHFFGILSDLFGADLYFDAAKADLEYQNYYVDEGYYLVEVVQLSLKYLDNHNWAREIYKSYLEKKQHYNGAEDIIPIAESIAKDLNDKKWEGEIYKDLLSETSDDVIKEIKDMYAYLFKKS